MASSTTNFSMDEINTVSRLKEFPSLLNLDIGTIPLNLLRAKLSSLETEDDEDDVCEEETIFKLNFKSWVYFKLELYKKALDVIENVLHRTNCKDVASLAFGAYLSLLLGRESRSQQCLNELNVMEESSNFQQCVAVANAGLAYAYQRMGTPKAILKAIELFETLIRTYPDSYHWKLRLGQVYRKSTNLNTTGTLFSNLSVKEREKKCEEFLTDVAHNSPDDRLRGPAYAELANLQHNSNYQSGRGAPHKNTTLSDLCHRALQCGRPSPWVLTACAKVLCFSDSDKAIDLLTQSLIKRENTTTYHMLGTCYVKKLKKSKDFRPDNEFYLKARDMYQKALEISHGVCYPTMSSFGQLYTLVGDWENALEYFNQITRIVPPNSGYFWTVINAYDQAGLCYKKMPGCEKMMEAKFTKAISLAASYASNVPDAVGGPTDLWVFLKDLQRGTAEIHIKRGYSAHSRLLFLLKNCFENVGAVRNLADMKKNPSDNIHHMRQELLNYLDKNQFEQALVFLNIVAIFKQGLEESESWSSQEIVDLRAKVLLGVCRERLQGNSESVEHVFQQLFKLRLGSCVGMLNEDNLTDGIPEQTFIGDVLVVSQDASVDDGVGQTSGEALELVLSRVFGLSSQHKACDTVQTRRAITMETMEKFQLCVILLERTARSEDFDNFLEMIPPLQNQDSASPTVLLVDTCETEVQDLPDSLLGVRRLKLQELKGLSAEARNDQNLTVQDLAQAVFGGNVDTVLKLFCFLMDMHSLDV